MNNDQLKTIKRRRSVRSYAKKAVEEDVLRNTDKEFFEAMDEQFKPSVAIVFYTTTEARVFFVLPKKKLIEAS